MDFNQYKVAFFSMEIGIKEEIPTYSGGLGILAGDLLRSSADLGLPIIGVTLLYKKGFFKQKIDKGWQIEEDENWNPKDYLQKFDKKVKIKIGKEEVIVGAWGLNVKGISGKENQIIFLDTDQEENPEHLKKITEKLYQGDRVSQEMVLGIAGVKMLKELGCNILKYHMNEGHSSFLTLALYQDCSTKNALEELQNKCVFTTHTPVAAGHDKFTKNLVIEKVSDYLPKDPSIQIFDGEELNMTRLGLTFSGHINGVAKKHKNVAQKMFPKYNIGYITNGAHTWFWASQPFQELFDKYLPNWKEDPFSLRGAANLPKEEVWQAHQKAKKTLISEVNKRTNAEFDESTFTIGFARRFVDYKRPAIILSDLKRLERIAQEKGGVQIIFAGKAHPNDTNGKELIKKTLLTIKTITNPKIKVVFLEDYKIGIAKSLVSGCDVWLNNPKRNYEASGTSGMKAAINGVPQLSTMDGWWLEGHIENITGWGIGINPVDAPLDEDETPDDEADDLYKKLEETILPLFYNDKERWKDILKSCIAINASFFNTHRVMQQYVMEAYFR